MAIQNNIMMSGLSLNADVYDRPGCVSCDYDFGWVFEHPSTLLWADKIILTPSIMQIIQKETWPRDKNTPYATVLHRFFDLAGEKGLVDVRKPNLKDLQPFIQVVSYQADKDRLLLAERYPDAVKLETKGAPGGLHISDSHYCAPRVAAFYFGAILARLWNATLLMNNHTQLYFEHRLGLIDDESNTRRNVFSAFEHVFSEILPEVNIAPSTNKKSCWNCKKLDACDHTQPKEIEKNIRDLLAWRDYDEIIQLRDVVTRIASRCVSDGSVSGSEIVREFQAERDKLHRQMTKLFPKVHRWSKFSTIMSVPIIVAGVTSGVPLVGGIGAGIAGLAKIAEKYVDILKSKNRWVCFNQSAKWSPNAQQ